MIFRIPNVEIRLYVQTYYLFRLDSRNTCRKSNFFRVISFQIHHFETYQKICFFFDFTTDGAHRQKYLYRLPKNVGVARREAIYLGWQKIIKHFLEKLLSTLQCSFIKSLVLKSGIVRLERKKTRIHLQFYIDLLSFVIQYIHEIF